MKGKIIHVAILVQDNNISGEIEDAINETLRPATQDPDRSLIIDYAFNTTGNVPGLPPPIPFTIKDNYSEGEFVKKVTPYVGNANL